MAAVSLTGKIARDALQDVTTIALQSGTVTSALSFVGHGSSAFGNSASTGSMPVTVVGSELGIDDVSGDVRVGMNASEATARASSTGRATVYMLMQKIFIGSINHTTNQKGEKKM